MAAIDAVCDGLLERFSPGRGGRDDTSIDEARTKNRSLWGCMVPDNDRSRTPTGEPPYSVLLVSSPCRSFTHCRSRFRVALPKSAARPAVGGGGFYSCRVCRRFVCDKPGHWSRYKPEPPARWIGRAGTEFIDGHEAVVSGVAGRCECVFRRCR